MGSYKYFINLNRKFKRSAAASVNRGSEKPKKNLRFFRFYAPPLRSEATSFF